MNLKKYKIVCICVNGIERGSKVQNFGVYGHTRGHTSFENSCVGCVDCPEAQNSAVPGRLLAKVRDHY